MALQDFLSLNRTTAESEGALNNIRFDAAK